MEQTKTMEQVTSTFTKKVGQTTYKVNVFFAENTTATLVLSVKLDAPAPCRLDASDLDLICYASADCLHQHLQVI